MGDQQSQLADYPDYQVLYKWKRKSFFCSSWKRNLPHFFFSSFSISPFFIDTLNIHYGLVLCYTVPVLQWRPKLTHKLRIRNEIEKKKRNSFFILRKLKCSQPTYHLALRNEYLIVRSQGLFILFLTSFFV